MVAKKCATSADSCTAIFASICEANIFRCPSEEQRSQPVVQQAVRFSCTTGCRVFAFPLHSLLNFFFSCLGSATKWYFFVLNLRLEPLRSTAGRALRLQRSCSRCCSRGQVAFQNLSHLSSSSSDVSSISFGSLFAGLLPGSSLVCSARAVNCAPRWLASCERVGLFTLHGTRHVQLS